MASLYISPVLASRRTSGCSEVLVVNFETPKELKTVLEEYHFKRTGESDTALIDKSRV